MDEVDQGADVRVSCGSERDFQRQEVELMLELEEQRWPRFPHPLSAHRFDTDDKRPRAECRRASPPHAPAPEKPKVLQMKRQKEKKKKVPDDSH